MMRNDPNDNRKYNYCYKITNHINKMIYIGVHRTDNINDNYMGSGKLIKRSIFKYGIENFTKEILAFFDTYKEALEYERKIVTIDFIEEDTNYNLREGGYGNCALSTIQKAIISESKKQLYANNEQYREKMNIIFKDPIRNTKIGKKVKTWILENPELHKEKMDKINYNPTKIKKTAAKHRGMKRSDEAKRNMSISHLNLSAEQKKAKSGVGCFYIINNETKEVKRHIGEIPLGWSRGSGPKKNKERYKSLNKGSFFAYNIHTGELIRLQQGTEIPQHYIKGRPTKNG